MSSHDLNKGPGRPFVEERPSTEQLNELYVRFGRPEHHHQVWDLAHRDEGVSAPSCSGEVVIVIFDDASRCCYVSRRESPADRFFPMGRIGIGESIEGAAIREAKEETGLTVSISGVPMLYIVDIEFKEWDLRRWHLVAIARSDGQDPRPNDTEEIGSASFLEGVPYNGDPFLMGWAKELLRRTSSIIDHDRGDPIITFNRPASSH